MTISLLREQKVLKFGSPYFLKVCAAIPIGGFLSYSLADLDSAAPKYAPLDFLEVTNLDASASVLVRLDDGDSFRVAPGAIRSISQKPWRRLSVRNLGAAEVAAGLVSLLAQREPITQDTYIRRFKLR